MSRRPLCLGLEIVGLKNFDEALVAGGGGDFCADYGDWLDGVVLGGCGCEIVLFAEALVDAAGYEGGGWAFDLVRLAAEENGERDFRVLFVGVSDEPADLGTWVVAGASLAERGFVAAGIEAALRRAVENSGEHAFANFRKNRSDVEVALYLGLKILDVFGSARILQIVERAAVGERGRERDELERRDLNAFAEAGHASDATLGRGRHRERTRVLFRQVVAGKFAEAEEAGVLRNCVETHANAELLEEIIVGVSERFGEVHVARVAIVDAEHGVARDDIFFEGGDCNGRLDRGARDEAIAECDFLIHDGEDAAGVRVHSDDGTVITAEAFDSGFADDGIIERADVSERGIGESRNTADTGGVVNGRFTGSGGGSGWRSGRNWSSHGYGGHSGEKNFGNLLQRRYLNPGVPDRRTRERGCF